MKKIYNNKSIYYKDWTSQKLKNEATTLYDLIYGKNSCYGTKDMYKYSDICVELQRRGIMGRFTFD